MICFLFLIQVSLAPDQLVVTTGLRGLCALKSMFLGPKQDLHSGVHGGALYNPLQALMRICSSLHDKDGKVTVPGFYDNVRPPENWERDELSKLPITEESYAEFLGVQKFFPPPGYENLKVSVFVLHIRTKWSGRWVSRRRF